MVIHPSAKSQYRTSTASVRRKVQLAQNIYGRLQYRANSSVWVINPEGIKDKRVCWTEAQVTLLDKYSNVTETHIVHEVLMSHDM